MVKVVGFEHVYSGIDEPADVNVCLQACLPTCLPACLHGLVGPLPNTGILVEQIGAWIHLS